MGCRGRGDKRSLIRVVRTPEGRVEIDPTGKAPGRGAYVHAGVAACVDVALKRGALARALKAEVPSELGNLLSANQGATPQ